MPLKCLYVRNQQSKNEISGEEKSDWIGFAVTGMLIFKALLFFQR